MNCPKLTKKDIINIFRQIVEDFPYLPCKQLDTFALVDGDDAFSTTNLKKTYEDYQAGFFWSRSWVLAGADPNTLCATYPALILEHKKSTYDNIRDDSVCHEFYLLVTDLLDCGDCECKRTPDQVKCDVMDVINSVLKEFVTYKLYDITDGEDEYQAWLSDGRKAYLQAENPEMIFEFCCNDIAHSVNSDNIEINEWKSHSNNKVVGYATRLTICDCRAEKVEYDYTEKSVKELSTASCLSCD